MLVFGESILNDAVAIVLTNVIVESKRQFGALNSTKVTAYSMIGLLASSNLTTIPTLTAGPRHRGHNGLVEHRGQASLYEPNGELPDTFRNNDDRYLSKDDDDDDEENNDQDVLETFRDGANVPAQRKRSQGEATIEHS